MDCKIKTMYQLKVIGFERIFDSENSYQEIPKFWNEFFEKYSGDSLPDSASEDKIEKAVRQNNIEWYGKGDTASEDYHSAIWIPVGKKE